MPPRSIAADGFGISAAPDLLLDDYSGLTARPTPSGFEVWTSFMGSRDLDWGGHKSVIFGSRIPWLNP